MFIYLSVYWFSPLYITNCAAVHDVFRSLFYFPLHFYLDSYVYILQRSFFLNIKVSVRGLVFLFISKWILTFYFLQRHCLFPSLLLIGFCV